MCGKGRLLGVFCLGFACCALIAPLLFPISIGAVSPALLPPGASPADIAAAVGESVVSLESFAGPIPERAMLGWSGLVPTAAAEELPPDAVASGVVISSDGYVVTNEHVVHGVAALRARLVSGKEYSARVVGVDRHSDLAMVKLEARDLVPAFIGRSRRVRPGDTVVAIGNPLGFENSVSVGVVSANRAGPFRVDGNVLGDMIQTDAALNRGNSGGGLFNTRGQLVGINTSIMAPRGGSGNLGIGFAIPTHRMSPIADSLILRGKLLRPWLGIRYRSGDPATRVRPARAGAGVVLEDVVLNGPAARAGLRPSDILRRLGESPVYSGDDIYRFIEEHKPGQKVEAVVVRQGRELRVPLVLTAQSAEAASPTAAPAD